MNFINLDNLPKELIPYLKKAEKAKTPLSIILASLDVLDKIESMPSEVKEKVYKEFNKVPVNIIMDDD